MLSLLIKLSWVRHRDISEITVISLRWCRIKRSISATSIVIGVKSWGVWGFATHRFWDRGVVRVAWSPRNIIVPYNAHKIEVRKLSKSGDYSEIERFVHIKKIREKSCAARCAPPGVELSGPTNPLVFQPGPTTLIFQTRLTPLPLIVLFALWIQPVDFRWRLTRIFRMSEASWVDGVECER